MYTKKRNWKRINRWMDGWAIWWQSPLVFVFLLNFILWNSYLESHTMTLGLAWLGWVGFGSVCCGWYVCFINSEMPIHDFSNGKNAVYYSIKWSFSRCSCSLYFTVLCAEFLLFLLLSCSLEFVAAVRFYIVSLGSTESGQRIKFRIRWRHKKLRRLFYHLHLFCLISSYTVDAQKS